jgi:Predicted amidohydrolase
VKDVVDVALVQFAPTTLDPIANREAMIAAVRRIAREHPADLVVFPELATTGYPPPDHDAWYGRLLARAAEPVPGPTTEALCTVAAQTGAHVATGIAELRPGGDLANALVLVTPAGRIVVHRKVHLFGTEAHYFVPGDRLSVADTDLGRIGLSVCYDSKFPEAARSQALAGAEILVCVFAYADDPAAPLDLLTHRAVVRAWENQVHFVAVNRLGEEYGVRYVGRSVAADPSGRILTRGHGAEDPVVRARLTRRALTEVRRGPADRRPDVYGDPAPAVVVQARTPPHPGRESA